MNVWIRRLRSLFAAPLAVVSHVPLDLSLSHTPPGEGGGAVRASAPPITDLDLLRALGCDV